MLQQVFGIHCRFHNLTYFLYQGLYHKETPLVIETIKFTTEPLAFQNKHSDGAHSISDMKLLGCNSKLFTDDTSLFATVNNINKATIDLNNDLTKIKEWSMENEL